MSEVLKSGASEFQSRSLSGASTPQWMPGENQDSTEWARQLHAEVEATYREHNKPKNVAKRREEIRAYLDIALHRPILEGFARAFRTVAEHHNDPDYNILTDPEYSKFN